MRGMSSQHPDKPSGNAGAGELGRTWGRRLVTFLAVVVTLPVVVIVVGALFPPVRLIAVIGCVFESFFTTHVFLAGLAGIALAVWARRLGGGRVTTAIVWLAIAATVGAAIPSSRASAAPRIATACPFPGRHTFARPRAGPRATPDQTQLFATVDGKSLYLDIYLPASLAGGSSARTLASLSAPVVMIHGGGYSAGKRSDGAQLGPLAYVARLHRL